jgi:hemerythrin-like domain-containing protein
MTALNTDAPLTNFSHCHEDMFEQLRQLAELPALLAPAALARETAQQALTFFQDVMFTHHQEEEKDLFPAVQASAQKGEERLHVDAWVDGLVAGHRSLEKLWHGLEPELKKAAKGQDSHVSTAQLEAFVTRYSQHAAQEEQKFLPLAERILSRNSNHMAALGLSLHMHHIRLPIAHM